MDERMQTDKILNFDFLDILKQFRLHADRSFVIKKC